MVTGLGAGNVNDGDRSCKWKAQERDLRRTNVLKAKNFRVSKEEGNKMWDQNPEKFGSYRFTPINKTYNSSPELVIIIKSS